MEIDFDIRKFLKLQSKIRTKIQWQTSPTISSLINSGFAFTVNWLATYQVWNQDKGINSNITNSQASNFRTFFIKATHNHLPTLSLLFTRKPHLYKSSTCPRCKLLPESNDHIWTCNNSALSCHIIFSKLSKFIYKTLNKLPNTHNSNITITTCESFCLTASFIIQPSYNYTTIG